MKLSKDKILELIKKSRVSRDGKDVYGVCPWCGHDEFGISLSDNHQFNCFRKKKCGETGNIYTLLKFLKEYSFFNKTYQPKDTLAKLSVEEDEEFSIEVPTIKLPIGFMRTSKSNYLDDRGFKAYDKYGVGRTKLIYSLKKYIIFQVFEDGELKGYLGRFESDEKVKRKYRNSEGTDFAKLVLGLDELNESIEEILMVEGVFDKENVDEELNLEENEIRKCVCTFGARCTDEQLIKIMMRAPNLKRIYVMHESDVINSVKKTGLRCQNYVKDTKVCHLDEKDPGDMSEKELVNCLSLSKDPLAFNVGTVKKGILR